MALPHDSPVSPPSVIACPLPGAILVASGGLGQSCLTSSDKLRLRDDTASRRALAPPAHLRPGVAHGVFELLPCPFLLRLPAPPGFGLEGRPVAAGILSVARQVIAVPVGGGPALIAMSLAPA